MHFAHLYCVVNVIRVHYHTDDISPRFVWFEHSMTCIYSLYLIFISHYVILFEITDITYMCAFPSFDALSRSFLTIPVWHTHTPLTCTWMRGWIPHNWILTSWGRSRVDVFHFRRKVDLLIFLFFESNIVISF